MTKTIYRVQAGAYLIKANADKMKAKIDTAVEKRKSEGKLLEDISVECVKEGSFWKVQCGAFENNENAKKRLSQINDCGFKKAVILEAKVTVPSGEDKKPSASSGPDKIYAIAELYIDSKTAHADFVKDYNGFIASYNKKHGTKHSKITLKNAWCTEFVDYIFWKAGFLDLIGYGKQARDLMENAKKKGTWKDGAGDIARGDVVIYKNGSGDPNHTEFALGGMYFLSGNCRGGVHKRKRASLGSVKGRIRPKYPK